MNVLKRHWKHSAVNKMKMEVIFRELIGEDEFLCWFTVQGEPIETSPFDLDRAHREFGEECIDHEYGGHEAQPISRIEELLPWNLGQNPSIEVAAS
jgi:hypothetical protein